MLFDNVISRIEHYIVIFFIGYFLISNLGVDSFAENNSGDYIHYRLGIKYKNEKNYKQAIDEFRKVLAAYPDNYNAYMHMAEIRLVQGRTKLQIYNLEKALSYNPGWSKALKMLASAYEKDQQNQKAVIELQKYIQICDPSERDSIQHKIDQLIKKTVVNEKSTDLDSYRKKARNVHRPEIDAAFRKVVEYYTAQKYDSSLAQIHNVLKIQPDYAGAFYYAGLIRRKKGQNKMAKINFLKSVDYPELGYNAHFYLGKIYSEEKNYSKAIQQLLLYISKTNYEQGKKEAQDLVEKYRQLGGNKAIVQVAKQDTVAVKDKLNQLEIRIDSLLTMLTIDTLTDAGQKLLSGIREFQAGNYDKSIREFKKIFADNPDGVIALHCLYNTGINYFKLRLFNEAENQFSQVLGRFSNHDVASDALFLKALTYLERRDPSVGEKLLRKFIQNHRDHKWGGKAYEKLGDAYNDLEQPGKAVDAYSQAVKTGKPMDQVCASFKLGNTFLQLKNTKRAIESFEKAIQYGEKNNIYIRVPDSYFKIADEYFRHKNYDKSLTYYKQVSRKYPSFQETPWAIFQIGSIQKNLKNYKEAIEAFKTLIRTHPDDYWAKQARLKLEDTVWEYEYRTVLN